MDKAAIRTVLANRLGISPDTAKILVVGLGVTGMSVARFLQYYGFDFAIVDSRAKPPFIEELNERMPGIAVFIGGFDQPAFAVATHMVVSPGISLNEPTIKQAILRHVKVISDIDLFACAVQKPVAAITGSNGKSTVTTMLGKMAKYAGKKVAVGGNLGIPALDLLQPEVDLYVLELSSFQLERTSALNAAVATVLNVTPDHMDRHGNLEQYAVGKKRIFNGDGVVVLNADDPIVSAMHDPARKSVTFGLDHAADFHVEAFQAEQWIVHSGKQLMQVRELRLEGRHNLENALAGLALGYSLGLQEQAMCNALREFKGLEHRMQRVAEINGVVWVNDSKATNIGACIAALRGGYDKKIVLIAGGDAKGAEMHDLAAVVQEKAKAVILMGKDADLIKRALNGRVQVSMVENMQQAVREAAGIARQGDYVLLSPACASLDQFENYQDRGQKFIAAVRSLVA